MTGRMRKLVAVAAIAGCWPATATADTVRPSSPRRRSSARRTACWPGAAFDAATGAWFLTTRRDGLVQRLPIAPRAVPFDVDVGRDARGRVVAA